MICLLLFAFCLSVDNPEVQNLGLVLMARGGTADFERAGFVIASDDGTFRLIEWPSQHLYHRAEWKGPIPVSAVAIIHTHPPRRARPSPDDIQIAMRLKMPVFVIAGPSLCVAMETGEVRCSASRARD
jgi:proteasome lid subunit RPN8/RPN11